jgi:hypothetical protein
MKRAPVIPATPGVFVVLHAKARVAYVGKAKDLRQRAAMWAYHLKNPKVAKTTRVRKLPVLPFDEWEYLAFPGGDEVNVRATLDGRGVEIINPKSRTRTTYVVEGVEGTLMDHARRYNKPWASVYKRVERGMTPEEALGLTGEPADPREQHIEMMKVKIVTDSGGWVTYDEACQMRPELGDVRLKVSKWRKANPDATEVKLSNLQG